MIEAPVIDAGEWPGFGRRWIVGAGADLYVRHGGAPSGPPVLLNHSILTSSAVWRRTAQLLAGLGFHVICVDTRGHGASPARPAPYAMDDLVADNVMVLDAFEIERVHFIGVSLGGMTGLGLGIRRPDRLESLCVIGARADSPAAFAASWDERIDTATRQSVSALAAPTVERWFGPAFVEAYPDISRALQDCIAQTSLDGFVGCARAIQGLDYLPGAAGISARTTLLVGARDTALIEPMRELAPQIPDATFEIIEAAGHLPQLDGPDQTEAAILRHLRSPARPA